MRYRHKKRGSTYRLVGAAKVQAAAPIKEGDTVAVYVTEAGEHAGELWVRPYNEFMDGRFEQIGEDNAGK